MKHQAFLISMAALATTPHVAEGQTCVVGEPASMACTLARQIPGTPGQHVVLVDVGGASVQGTVCGLQAGKHAWFAVTPTVSGPMIISTCHPNTGYDTLLEVFTGGDSGCDFMSPVSCNDDFYTDACDNGCSYYGSTASIDAVAGQLYRFVVGAIDDNAAGCPLCLGVIVTIEPTCGEPPTNIGPCDAAYELPTSPGVYEILQDVDDAVVLPFEPGPLPSCTGAVELYRTVWYHLQPQADSHVRFDTCHENTSYDTVVQVFTGGGLCGQGQFSIPVACSDDFADDACINACNTLNPRGSRVSFKAQGGSDYWLQVGAYSTGCEGCLGANLEITDCSVSDPPTARIAAPPEFGAGCACAPVSIVGTATGESVPIEEYRLEYRQVGTSAWTELATGAAAVRNGVLGEWNTTGLPQGHYVLRLAATNVCGERSTDSVVVFLDQGFDTLDVRYPPDSAGGGQPPVVAGQVCIDGTVFESWCWNPGATNAHYAVDSSPHGAGTFFPVDSTQPTYRSTVVAAALASWDTLRQGIPDGTYDLRVAAENDCGLTQTEMRQVVVDNTLPTAQIDSVRPCEYVDGLVEIIGSAVDANMGSWFLQYAGAGTGDWVTIASGFSNIVGDTLGVWDTTTLPACAYALRLVVTDQAVVGCGGPVRHRSEVVAAVNVGSCGDFDTDDDGDVDLFDYRAFQHAFTGSQP